MVSTIPIPARQPSHLRSGEETLIDFRRRRELDEEARVERKRLDVAEQTSSLNVASVRIRAWELVHALRMPSSAEHPILELIAVTTQLSLADVRAEQRVRSGAAVT